MKTVKFYWDRFEENLYKDLPLQVFSANEPQMVRNLVCRDTRNYRAARAICNLSKNGLGQPKELVKGEGVSDG
ncbi:hypothetical protein [Cyclobacterium xiamenense]|uniref:hypothetical protein n=1 Tax=Cyclobacterium xiamenense TaxID=1297121 RepID=UPI0035D04EE3